MIEFAATEYALLINIRYCIIAHRSGAHAVSKPAGEMLSNIYCIERIVEEYVTPTIK